jgi:hypothetical protein
MKLVIRRWMTVAGTNVNFESSVGSPSLELLISRRSFSESMPKAEKRRIKLKERKVRISVYSYIKRDPSSYFLLSVFFRG